jgi:hypothetical protein
MGGDKELIDRLLAEYKSPEEIVGLLKQSTGRSWSDVLDVMLAAATP